MMCSSSYVWRVGIHVDIYVPYITGLHYCCMLQPVIYQCFPSTAVASSSSGWCRPPLGSCLIPQLPRVGDRPLDRYRSFHTASPSLSHVLRALWPRQTRGQLVQLFHSNGDRTVAAYPMDLPNVPKALQRMRRSSYSVWEVPRGM